MPQEENLEQRLRELVSCSASDDPISKDKGMADLIKIITERGTQGLPADLKRELDEYLTDHYIRAELGLLGKEGMVVDWVVSKFKGEDYQDFREAYGDIYDNVVWRNCFINLSVDSLKGFARLYVNFIESHLGEESGKVNNAEALEHFKQGYLFQIEQNHNNAIPEYLKAIKLNPNLLWAHNNLGYALARTGDIEKAIEEYQKAINIDPNHAKIHYNLGLAFKEKGNLNEAISEYRTALKLDPQNESILRNLELVLKQKK